MRTKFAKSLGRKEKIFINVFSSLVSEIISMICALILPRLILTHFGSSYNGIINSITQFISYITLLRAGVGGVTRASLYKPLAEGNTEKISSIINATQKFMRKIAFIFLISMTCIALVYPLFINDFDWPFTFSLFMIIGISTFIQYYFGITYQMLLLADQKNYIYTIFNIISIVLNTAIGSTLILMNFNIHVVKIGSAIAFSFTPILLNIYVKKRYKLDKAAKPDKNALKQRWDALGHQIANYILNSTDLTILTIVADVRIVSVYSVYYLVIKAIKTIVKTYSSSVEAAFGNIIAKSEKETLVNSFNAFECFMCISCALVFSCTTALIIPFVKLYTRNVSDVNYIEPIFAILLIIGQVLYCLRIPYMSLIEAYGMYKQTKIGAYAEAIINVISSIIFSIFISPLIGVAIGTLLALGGRTFEISRFVDKKILKRSRFSFYRSLVICISSILLALVLYKFIPYYELCYSYGEWIILSIFTCICLLIVIFILAMLLYRNTVIMTVKMIFLWKGKKKNGK